MTPEDMLSAWLDDYLHRLVPLANTYVHNWATSEDIVQDAMTSAMRTHHQLRDHSKAFPWLVKIVVNKCLSYRRRHWREVIVHVLPERETGDTEQIAIQHQEHKQLYHAVMSLGHLYRTPIILFYFEELSTQEIADVLGINSTTVRTRLNRGREKLKKKLQRGGQNDGHRKINPKTEDLL